MDKNKKAVEIFDKLAELYQSKFMNVDKYGHTLDIFCEVTKKQNAAILELACGPGNITKYLLNKRPDFHLLGTDLSPEMIRLSKTNNPSATFEILDGRKPNLLNKKFDAIMIGFLLPYLSKEEAIQLISDCSELLHSEGVIYISTMEDDYSTSGLTRGSTGDEMFMHYHQEDYLVRSLEENQLNVIHLDRIKSLAQDESVTTDLILIAQK